MLNVLSKIVASILLTKINVNLFTCYVKMLLTLLTFAQAVYEKLSFVYVYYHRLIVFSTRYCYNRIIPCKHLSLLCFLSRQLKKNAMRLLSFLKIANLGILRSNRNNS